MPSTTKVCKKTLTKGQKLGSRESWAALRHATLDEMVGRGRPDRGPQRRSTWIPKKVRQWLRLLQVDLVAATTHAAVVLTTADPSGDERCWLCGKEARVVQLGVRLCKGCNDAHRSL